MTQPLRFGVLGAAKIAPAALIRPSQEGNEARVVVVAARDQSRAEQFARQHGIARVAADYAAVVGDPEIDAVYNPLPMNLHAEWTLAALRAGKHVLCEKPFAANAREARDMVETAEAVGLVLAEAFHYRYHPVFERILAIVHRGQLGPLRRVEGRFVVPITDTDDFRHRFETAGGATMDLGCYPLHWLRHVTGERPRVVRAWAREGNPHIDLTMTAELVFPSGVTGSMHASMAPEERFSAALSIEGEAGSLRVDNPLAPHNGHRITLRVGTTETTEQLDSGTTYRHQLVAFVAAVRSGTRLPTGGADAIENMELIDAVYRAAGMPVRGTVAGRR
ncbi:MAG: Gfo/Idh/MocA family oxidoreductase [Polyangiaceae bacterium]|nr:Gfo/Idh/MocA family oxidoreductase [Polyangiaceae bacterium]